MGKGLATRELIVDEALRQASRVGLEGLSLAPLADRLQLSKSGLFAHFKSKEALQLDILDEAIARFTRQVVAPGSREKTAPQRLRGTFERYLVWIRGADGDGGCLFMTAVQEYDDRPGAIRDRLAESQTAWRLHLKQMMHTGIAEGAFSSGADLDQAVFDMIGAALAYQHASRLLGDRSAKSKAIKSLDAILTAISR